jgi:hypothetical protein
MADHSRALRLANAITGEATTQLESRLEAARVSIAIDPEVPGADLTAEALVGTSRRLPGTIAIDPAGLDGGLVDHLVEHASEIDPDRPVEVRAPADGDIRVAIGPSGPAGVIRAIPDQHGYRLATAGGPLRQRTSASGLGSIEAAAAIAAEVFKVAAGVKGARGVPAIHTAFCPVTLTDDPGMAPPLPEDWQLRGMLLGDGAIGTGSAYIVANLPVVGEADLVDPQVFEAENIGTYSLGGVDDARNGIPKVDLVARALPRINCRRWQRFASEVPGLIDDGQMPWPEVVLAGLDSPEARWDAQLIWPNLLLDGATGDTMAGLHVVEGAGRPCERCFFQQPTAPTTLPGEDLSALTGLPRQLLVQGDRILTGADIDAVAEDRRAALRRFVGRRICALADAYGLTDLPDEGHRPAIPFVALMAAGLVVGRLIANELGLRRPDNFIQYDGLVGPGPRTEERRRGRPDCDCERKAEIIAKVIAARSSRR